MVLKTVKVPRDNVVLRANECASPRIYNNAGWAEWNGFGPGGQGTATFSPPTLSKGWTTAPSSADGCGFYYRHANFTAGQTKTCSIDVFVKDFEPNMGWRFLHYNSGGTLISANTSAPVTQTKINTTQRIAGSATAPAGTAFTDCHICITPGNYPQANQGFSISRCLIEPGAVVAGYFDATTYANGNGSQSTVWEGPADNSRSLLLDWDPKTLVQPDLVLGYDVSQDSRNVVHQLIDGGVAASLLPGSSRRGVLKLFFLTDASAETARAVHARSGYWQFTDDEQPQEGMTYVVNGTVRKYQDESRRRWTVEVPYQELI